MLIKSKRKQKAKLKKYYDGVKLKGASKNKYAVDEQHRLSLKITNNQKSIEMKQNRQCFDFVFRQFQDKVKNAPDFVCSICHRLLFKHQVVICNKDMYMQQQDIIIYIS